MTIVRDAELSSGFVCVSPLPGLTAVTHCGEAVTTQRHALPAHRHPGFEFMVACSGTYAWTVAGTTHTQTVGDMFVTFPDQPHATGPGTGASCHLLWLGVQLSELGAEGQRLADRLRAHDRHFVPRIPQVEPLLRGVLQQSTGAGPEQESVAAAYLLAFVRVTAQRLSQLEQSDRGPARNRLSYPVVRALQMSRAHLDAPIALERLAADAGVSESQLCRLFADELGCSPVLYHRRLRLDAAKARLLDADASIATVSAAFGFSSSQHLSTLFRETYGLTPRQWQTSAGVTAAVEGRLDEPHQSNA